MIINGNLDCMAETHRKEEGIFIRLTAEEKKALQIAADREDRKLADFVRVVFRKKLRELGLLPDVEEPKSKRR